MAETFTPNYNLSKFDQGDNPPILTAAKLNANLDAIDTQIKNRDTFDRFAATRIVDPAGAGTDLTIAAALAALPAEGGLILLKNGTYLLTATATLPAAKPVTILGCGDSTVISLGANAIAAFTIPTGYTTHTPIHFRGFKVTGTEVANQTLLAYGATNSLAEIFIQNVNTTGVEKTINVTSSAQSSTSPGFDDARFHLANCRIRPNATNNSVILSNPSSGYPRCWMTEVQFIGDSLPAIPVSRSAPLFGKLASSTWYGDCYLDGCEMSIGTGRSDFAAFESKNSIFWNNDNVNTIVDWFFYGSFSGRNNGTITGSTFRRIHIEVLEPVINFTSNWFQNCPLELYGQGIVLGDNYFDQSGTWSVSFPYVIQLNWENMVVRDNVFDIGAPATYVIDAEASCAITGNDFSEVTNGTNGSIYIGAGTAIVSNNRFEFAPTGGPPVRVTSGNGSFTDNWDLWWETSGSIDPPIIPAGLGNIIQGVGGIYGAASVGGTATNNVIINYRNRNGLSMTKGYIVNSGANNITVREQYFTVNQGTFTRSTVIAAAAKRVLDPFDLTGLSPSTPDNQVVKYTVDVSGTTISWSTYFPMPGAELR
jgi:hypothetical protein